MTVYRAFTEIVLRLLILRAPLIGYVEAFDCLVSAVLIIDQDQLLRFQLMLASLVQFGVRWVFGTDGFWARFAIICVGLRIFRSSCRASCRRFPIRVRSFVLFLPDPYVLLIIPHLRRHLAAIVIYGGRRLD